MSIVENKTLELARVLAERIETITMEIEGEEREYTSYEEVNEAVQNFLEAYNTYSSMRGFEAKYKEELEKNEELEKKNMSLEETLKQMQEEINKLTAPVPKVANIGQIG